MPERSPLAQYFTPPAVVDLTFAVLDWLVPDFGRGPLVDPSCGAGAFLWGALRAGWPARCLYGLDADPALAGEWRANGLLAAGVHLAVGDGLAGAGQGRFAGVVGNPPFAGTAALPPSLVAPSRFTWGGLGPGRTGRLPRELWFLERSLALLRPGGLLALVLPEGVFANRRWEAQRAVLLANNQVEAIIGLPRRTFHASRIAVKTCLLVARRQPPGPGHRVRLAELDDEEMGEAGARLIAAWERQATVSAGEPWATVRRR